MTSRSSVWLEVAEARLPSAMFCRPLRSLHHLVDRARALIEEPFQRSNGGIVADGGNAEGCATDGSRRWVKAIRALFGQFRRSALIGARSGGVDGNVTGYEFTRGMAAF